MPPFLTLFLRNALIGFGIAVAMVAGILIFDVAGLGGLMLGSAAGMMGAAMLTFFLGLTFGSVQIGIAVMAMAEDTAPKGKGPRIGPDPVPVPVRVTAKDKRRPF